MEVDYRLIFDMAGNGMAFTHATVGRIIDMNENLRRTVGLPCEETLGRTAVELRVWADFADRAACVYELEPAGRTTRR